MEKLHWKIRIAVLWVYIAVATLTILSMMIFDPLIIEQIISGEIQTSDGVLIFLWISGSLTMAFLSLILKDSANRNANISIGMVFTCLNILGLISTIFIEQRPVHEILTEASKVIVAALIVWHGWKWPKQEA